MTPLDDRSIRARFAALRAAERARAPEFNALVSRARRVERPRPRSRWLAWAAVPIAAALVIGTGVAVHNRRAREGVQPLATWTSPTAVFLSTPSTDLVQPPGLFTSVLDRVTASALPPKGE